jgi:hypothetical protein
VCDAPTVWDAGFPQKVISERSSWRETPWFPLRSGASVGNVVDDALHENDVRAEMARSAGQEVGDEVVDGRDGKTDGV